MSQLRGLRSSTLLRLTLGILLSALFLYVAVRNIDMRDVARVVGDAHVLFIFLALVSVTANTIAKAVRWKVLLGVAGRQVAFSRLLASLLVGQMLNTLLPVRVGDVTRAYAFGRPGPGRTFVLGTVVLEKLFDMIAYGLLVVVLLLAIPLPPWLDRSITAVVVIAVGAIALLVALTRFREGLSAGLDRYAERIPERLRAKTLGRVRSGLESVEIMRSGADVARVGWWSVVIWGTAILNNYLVLLALGIRLPLSASLLVLIVLQAGITLPSAPGRVGIFQYLCVLSLAVYGVGQTAAFSYGILLHGIVMIPPTLAGLLMVWRLGPVPNDTSPLHVVAHD